MMMMNFSIHEESLCPPESTWCLIKSDIRFVLDSLTDGNIRHVNTSLRRWSQLFSKQQPFSCLSVRQHTSFRV